MSRRPRLRVLIADDSPIVRELLTLILEAQAELEVVATAASGDEAAALARELAPDVITMDLQMPGSDGFAGIARIMSETPTPILVLSSDREALKGFRALSLGALDLLEKPSADELPHFGAELARRLRLLASVPVIRHGRGLRPQALPAAGRRAQAEVVVIGASLGGPRALAAVLAALPADFPTPIAVVQHISAGFTEGLARWLRSETRLEVVEATEGARLEVGRVLIAPGDRHLEISRGRAHLQGGAAVDGFRPSVSTLFHSAAASYGSRACGVLLTGMGKDGADGLLALRKAGALTIAQDEASCAVFGMPRAAIGLGAVEQVLPLGRIAAALVEGTR